MRARHDVILESIVTTLNEDGQTNISPMGPIVDPEITRLTLRPFQTSRTFQNLKRSGQGVLHVSDDVELFARAAVNRLRTQPATTPASAVEGRILDDACRWYAFEVRRLDDREPRTVIECEVVDSGRLRDFFGFNRAKHAVIEAAILATRVEFLPADEIRGSLAALEPLVSKTAGDQERSAFEFLRRYIESALDAD